MEAHTRASGRTVKDMDWVWKHVVGGYTEESGRKVTKVATASDRAQPVTQNTKAPGPTDCKMDMDLKPTRMEVRAEN